jgi:glycerol kinase
MLAAVGVGIYGSLLESVAMLPTIRSFDPAMEPGTRAARLARWQAALAASG